MLSSLARTHKCVKTKFSSISTERFTGFDLAVYLPSIESFLNCEVLKAAGLTENATFQFLLRAGYEQVLRTQSDMDVEI